MADWRGGTGGEEVSAVGGAIGVGLWGHGSAVLQVGHAVGEPPLGADFCLYRTAGDL